MKVWKFHAFITNWNINVLRALANYLLFLRSYTLWFCVVKPLKLIQSYLHDKFKELKSTLLSMTTVMLNLARVNTWLVFEIFTFVICLLMISIYLLQIMKMTQPHMSTILKIIKQFNYRISYNNRPWRLLNFKTVRCSAYWREALISKLGKWTMLNVKT